MRFNTTIPIGLKNHFEYELNKYRIALDKKNYSTAWHHLERSHILGQSYPIEHTLSHWLMLMFGFRQKDIKEVFGQLIRLFLGGWKSFIDQVPKGNTGSASVPPLKTMEPPKDLKQILKQYHKD